MKTSRIFPWLLALLVHGRAAVWSLGPVFRLGLPILAHVCRWAGAGLWVAGQAHAQSGASASISGLVPYSGNIALSDPTNLVNGRVGTVFKARITVINSGTDHQFDIFDCKPVPPGLTIDTNVGAKGYLLGVPTLAGTFPVTIFAGNVNVNGGLVSLPVTLVIDPNGSPPVIVMAPEAQLAAEGGAAGFNVVATGDPPLGFQWWHGVFPIPAGTLASLTLPKVVAADAGAYRVVVSNPAGSVTSAPVQLTVEPFTAPLRLIQSAASGQVFFFTVEGPPVGNYVLWKSPDAQNWFPFATQRVVTGSWSLATTSSVPSGFFRATASP